MKEPFGGYTTELSMLHDLFFSSVSIYNILYYLIIRFSSEQRE